MRLSIRSGLITLMAASVVPSTGVRAQAPAAKVVVPPASKGATAPAAKAEVPPPPKNLGQIIATVNDEKITKGDLVDFLSRYQIPPLSPEQIYNDAVETLVNTRLVGIFLARLRIAVPPERLSEAIAQLERDLKNDGQELQTALHESSQTMEDLRKEYTDRLRWVEYLKLKATDAELKKYAASHKDLVDGTQVRVSHIFLKVPPNAAPADKEKIRQKLLAIKQEIIAKKLSFADAANKYSEDPANTKEGSPDKSGRAGGDIGYFGLNSGIVDEFANHAFSMKPGRLSDPVESGHGYHLILLTDRKEGTPIDFEQQKPFILQLYAAELQKQILMAERKGAKIIVKPMPADLFQTAPPAIAAPATTKPDAVKGSTPK